MPSNPTLQSDNQVVFLVSNTFDHSQLISPDAGPLFGQYLNWLVDYLSNIEFYLNGNYIIVIDNRLDRQECSHLQELIPKIHRKIIFKLVDPLYEHMVEKYYQLIYELTQYEHVFFLSIYQPKEFVKLIENRSGNRMITLPYPFIKEKCLSLENKRKSKIIFSGSTKFEVYPYRWKFKFFSLPFRKWAVEFLDHPGYPDLLDNRLKHNFIKDQYIKFLSDYRFMFLGPSRCKIELQKYLECAYAGCVPVGTMPEVYENDPEISKYFIRIEFGNLRNWFPVLMSLMLSRKKWKTFSTGYRNAIASKRNPKKLNDQFLEALQSKSFYDS